jgi:hypothetical protein
VRQPVITPVLLAAVRRHVAPVTLDFCSVPALRVVAPPLQLAAQNVVDRPVQVAVLLAAVPPHVAAVTLLESRKVQVRGAGLARREVASSGGHLSGLSAFDEIGVLFL